MRSISAKWPLIILILTSLLLVSGLVVFVRVAAGEGGVQGQEFGVDRGVFMHGQNRMRARTGLGKRGADAQGVGSLRPSLRSSWIRGAL